MELSVWVAGGPRGRREPLRHGLPHRFHWQGRPSAPRHRQPPLGGRARRPPPGPVPGQCEPCGPAARRARARYRRERGRERPSRPRDRAVRPARPRRLPAAARRRGRPGARPVRSGAGVRPGTDSGTREGGGAGRAVPPPRSELRRTGGGAAARAGWKAAPGWGVVREGCQGRAAAWRCHTARRPPRHLPRRGCPALRFRGSSWRWQRCGVRFRLRLPRACLRCC